MADNRDVVLHDFEDNLLFPRAYKDNLGHKIAPHLSDVEDEIWEYHLNPGSPGEPGDKDKWNAHIANTVIHTTAEDKEKWNDHVDDASLTTPTYHLKSGDRENLDLLPYELAEAPQTVPTPRPGKDGLMSKEDKEKLDNIINLIYPVGSVFSSTNNSTPTYEGTTWESITALTNPTVYRWTRTV